MVKLISYFHLFFNSSSNQPFWSPIQPNGSPWILISCLFAFNLFFIYGLCFMVESAGRKASSWCSKMSNNYFRASFVKFDREMKH